MLQGSPQNRKKSPRGKGLKIEEYCKNICGGKCCTLRMEVGGEIQGIDCVHLNESKSCNIYSQRFAAESPDKQFISLVVLKDTGQIGEFWCWRISKLIADNRLPKDIESQCCIAHPELLEGQSDGNESKSAE